MRPDTFQTPRRTFALAAALLCAVGSLVVWSLYFALYWQHRDRFDAAGRYVDKATLVVYHEQAGVLAVPAVALSVAAVVLGLIWRARRPAV